MITLEHGNGGMRERAGDRRPDAVVIMGGTNDILSQSATLAQIEANLTTLYNGAIAAGADVFTGAGHGPLNHGHAPQSTRVL